MAQPGQFHCKAEFDLQLGNSRRVFTIDELEVLDVMHRANVLRVARQRPSQRIAAL